MSGRDLERTENFLGAFKTLVAFPPFNAARQSVIYIPSTVYGILWAKISKRKKRGRKGERESKSESEGEREVILFP